MSLTVIMEKFNLLLISYDNFIMFLLLIHEDSQLCAHCMQGRDFNNQILRRHNFHTLFNNDVEL